MQATSIRLTEANHDFLEKYLTAHKKANRSALINRALELFRKYSLQKELMSYARQHDPENRTLAEVDFKDYLKIIDEF